MTNQFQEIQSRALPAEQAQRRVADELFMPMGAILIATLFLLAFVFSVPT